MHKGSAGIFLGQRVCARQNAADANQWNLPLQRFRKGSQASGAFGKSAAYWMNSHLDDLSRSPDTPAYLSLHYRLRCLRFALEPHHADSIVFLGDSMTDNGNWKDLFPHEHVINMGIGGDTTQGLLNRLPQVIRLKPKKIFLGGE